MTISRDAYPTEPRILVTCGLVGVQSNIIGKGGPAIRNRKQAAREKCCNYNWEHSERYAMAVSILRMKILPECGVRMIDGENSTGTAPLRKTMHHLSPLDILGLGVYDMNL